MTEPKTQTTPREHQDKEPFRLLSVLCFDDGYVSAEPLHTGTLDDCRKLMEEIPAIAYSGEKKVTDSYLKICDKDQWTKLQEEAA